MRFVAWTTQQSPRPHNAIFSGLRRPSGPIYLIMHGDSIRPVDSLRGLFCLLSDGFPSLSEPIAASSTAAEMYLHAPT